MESATAPVHLFRAAVEAGDLDAALALLAPDVVFHSPVTFKPYEGLENVGALIGAVFETFEDFRYTDEFTTDDGADGPVHALLFSARVGEKRIEGLDVLRIGSDGLVVDFTVMVRPLSAAIALAEAMGPKLAERGVEPAR